MRLIAIVLGEENSKIRNSEGIQETQIMYISEDEIEAVLKPYERETNANI